MIEILERRIDGSFVITHEGMPYHVTPDYSPELWAEVCAQEELDPEAQAAVYMGPQDAEV
jgi:hypothetical protein